MSPSVSHTPAKGASHTTRSATKLCSALVKSCTNRMYSTTAVATHGVDRGRLIPLERQAHRLQAQPRRVEGDDVVGDRTADGGEYVEHEQPCGNERLDACDRIGHVDLRREQHAHHRQEECDRAAAEKDRPEDGSTRCPARQVARPVGSVEEIRDRARGDHRSRRENPRDDHPRGRTPTLVALSSSRRATV